MTTLPDLIPYPAAQECVRWVTAKRGLETGAALVDFLLFCDVTSCAYQAEGESVRKDRLVGKPAVSAGSRGVSQAQVQGTLL